MTEVMADTNMIPSIPILTTAARSLITPQRAASAIGVALTREVFIIPTRSIDFPLAAQIRKAATKQNATTPTSKLVDRIPRANCQAPTKNVTSAST